MANKTIIDVLQDSRTASGRYNPNDVVRPAAIIWTDAEFENAYFFEIKASSFVLKTS